MTRTESPLIYIILGAYGSGRRQVLADLIEGGLTEDERALVVINQNEADPADEKAFSRLAHWSFTDGQISVPDASFGEATHVFFVLDGRANPIDQIEAFKPWQASSGAQLGRIFCVVNCRLAEQHPELIAWYEACIHFTDVVLLAHREGVANKWMSDFQAIFKDKFFPCLFELVKNGRVKNPALLLEPEARRVSHLFDEPDWEVLGEEGIDAEDPDAGEATDGEEEVELVEKVDEYLERRAGGRRVKEIPDIGKFLRAAQPSS